LRDVEVGRWNSNAETTISKSASLFFDARRGISSCRVHDITNGDFVGVAFQN
jgi:hypothetical protein